jgi:asparagine synthase (glutamine-hydrolysing)
MCGIAGILDARAERDSASLSRIAGRMSECLVHRGPDDAGVWADASEGVGLGFRRLAILDLSSAGHQPMLSADSRYVVVFNGEIYNHRSLRRELHGYPFRGHSDTEVMLAAFSRWGVCDATRRFNGMFAFAVWDRQRKSLTLGRDRLGEKPLYYGAVGKDFVFASELKALRSFPGFIGQIDRDALRLYVRHGYIPSPYSIYRGIAKLPPGTLLEVQARSESQPRPYWSAREAAVAGIRQPFDGTEDELLEALHTRLREAVGLRLEADVPLGAFLSGGIDSSLVVALMQANSSSPVRTFTIGFTESDYDEAPRAKAVASHLGTAHTEMYVTPSEAQDVIPRIPAMYDEPFADSSQIPTFLVSQLARSQVTVSLSGDGGDEMFAGYSRYLLLDQLWTRLQRVPRPARRALARCLEGVSPPAWDALFQRIGGVLPRQFRQSHPGEKIHKLAGGLRRDSASEVYLHLVSQWDQPEALVIGGTEPVTALGSADPVLDAQRPSTRAMYIDSITYLPDDILTKVDRAGMAVSLETRMPLLDHTLYEFAWTIPPSLRIRDDAGKYLLRRVLHQYVPRALVDRPKMGFGIPVGGWLRSSLRDWAEDLLDERCLRDQGLLQVGLVRQTWRRHLSSEVDAGYRLWTVLMLQAWLRQQDS